MAEQMADLMVVKMVVRSDGEMAVMMVVYTVV
jgi:hypothetical protein